MAATPGTNPGANPGANRTLAAGVVTAVLGSLCCVGPLVLLGLGVSGAWIGHLTALEPYRPLFIAVTVLFLALAFRRLYWVPRVCAPGTPCADPRTLRTRRVIFWVVSLALIALLAAPWIAQWFLD